jgi:putative aldouronate transport system substrate-binding protein
MKKFTSLLIVLFCIFSYTACSLQKDTVSTNLTDSGAKSDESATKAGSAKLTYWVTLNNPNLMPNYDYNKAYETAQTDTNIDIEWIHPPVGQEAETFNLLLASSDLPDIIQYNWGGYPGGAEAAINGNIIIALNDIIANKMPNFSKILDKFPDVDKMIKTDSGLYCYVPYIYTTTPENSNVHKGLSERIPAYETYLGMIIRKDWLEQLNLPIPVTIDDWFTTLTAFKERKNTKAPFSITTNFLKRTVVFASAYNIALDLFEDEGTVKYGPYEPAYLEYLTVLNKMYKEKLLDNDFAMLDNSAMGTKVMTSQTGIWAGYSSTQVGGFYDQLHEENPDTTFYPIGIPNPVSTKGQKLKYRQATYPVRPEHAAAITISCKDFDSAAKFLDYGFSEKGSMVLNYGPEGGAYEIKDGWPALTDAVGNNPDGLAPNQAFENFRISNGPFAVDHWTRLLTKRYYKTTESINALITWEYENGLYPGSLPPISLLPDETSAYANLYNEINTYVSEKYTQFIMGVEPLDNFNSYISALESMGIKDILRMQQAALDRYYAR